MYVVLSMKGSLLCVSLSLSGDTL